MAEITPSQDSEIQPQMNPKSYQANPLPQTSIFENENPSAPADSEYPNPAKIPDRNISKRKTLQDKKQGDGTIPGAEKNQTPYAKKQAQLAEQEGEMDTDAKKSKGMGGIAAKMIGKNVGQSLLRITVSAVVASWPILAGLFFGFMVIIIVTQITAPISDVVQTVANTPRDLKQGAGQVGSTLQKGTSRAISDIQTGKVFSDLEQDIGAVVSGALGD
ncbi:MAG: hypothetical protein G01um101418_348 [Parcubacteria group bacterium Gr01-1014_18]|nr:MAG: hypothetical protein Greene041636_276 [Parcubacteria group bacterium Greene0416_36]TSC81208.1 MAG: hypothetical protein G01um101418_348 [Parcubacteria group bacterium Gr01-1014_18]TSC99205.1 MAG: hypothetical protein Greene101420_350 [Parcubacteria group bacterium Greene1014_20]TSD07437.1 MAG: hypothetical protein Greene07142_136 [Parcubacteria group bacterium Greene0714_2]